ncbi:protein MON2 homolog isoform X2 [Rhodamnia argentea]|nr:protein MON2 homolog isoform X2 [Rhodamnia argentea]
MACEVRTVKLSVIGLSCLQKLISHDAVAPSALKEILSTLKDHSEMNDETVQLKTLQTILIILQSQLHPENEENMAQVLGICLRLLESHRSSDNVRNTAAATFRQAVALIFDHVVAAESLHADKFGVGGHLVRTSSVTGDVGRSMNLSESLEHDFGSGGPSSKRETLSKTGKLGLRLLEDLTALGAGGSAVWLHVGSLQRIFALEILEFILSNYAVVFKTLISYEQVLRHQICSLLMTSLRTNAELEGEAGEPSFRRLVLRSVAHIIRLYSSSLITECEVFLSMLVKVTFLDLPLWHRILVLEILRGFCVEARTLKTLFLNFDMNPKNTNVVEGMVKALARVVSSVQGQETSEESLAAVAGMFSSKAKGIEWSLDNDASNAAVLVASEAHAITLAIEGLLGVVFTVATLTDEAVDIGELESPRSGYDPPLECTGKTALLCVSLVDSLWLIVLDALSLILARSQGEAIVLEILKGYQAFTQACGVLRAVEPLNSFLASLCKFTINFPVEADKKSNSSLHSPGSKRSEATVDQKESIVLTPKNVQALRTLFNIAHRLHNVLGPSWVLVLETLAALDRAIHSPHAATQEVATTVPQLTRESSGLYSDFNILSSLNSQLFESSALMHISAVKSLLTALRQLSHQSLTGMSSVFGAASSQKIGTISFSVEGMMSILVNNLHRVHPIWDQVVGHFLELIDNSNLHVRNMALDALDRSISSVLGSDQFQESLSSGCGPWSQDIGAITTETGLLECAVISPLGVLYSSNQSIDVRATTLKILLHVLERYADKLRFSWPDILEMLRSVADASEKDLVTLGFQSLRVIMNDGLSTLPTEFLPVCIDVTGAYSAQKTELNISLTSIGLLWTAADFIARGLGQEPSEEKEKEAEWGDVHYVPKSVDGEESLDETSAASGKENDEASSKSTEGRDKLLFSVFLLLQKLGADERPEVRNSAVRTLFQTLGSHGQKLSKSMWEDCLWNYVFPMLDQASHMAATSSKDEWRGKELGTRGGKAVHMLIHHSRNTAQKQWDETLVLVLNGISRILRSFFPFLRSLRNFWSGWESLLIVVRDSILNGSKEVALAAVSSLHMTVVSHSLKGNLPMPYLTSVLEVYEFVFQRSSSYGVNSTSKAKQEILHGLGELYVQSRSMFDSQMYTQLLAIIDLAIKQSMMGNENVETDIGNISPIQRTVLEILPLLQPTEQLSSWWLILLREVLHYLPHPDESLRNEEEEVKRTNAPDGNQETRSEAPNGIASTSLSKAELDSPSSKSKPMCISSNVFPEKVIPVLVDLCLRAPTVEKHITLPEIVDSLGRCMKSRRDNPYAGLWRTAVEGFNRIVLNDVGKLKMNSGPDANISRQARVRFWKEVADVYEVFLVGCCGRALPTDYLPAAAVKADESLEMTVLNILGDDILKSPIDASADILQRLVSTLDRCASRTCTLPIDTVELMPPHSSRFSLTCLEKLFALTSYDSEACNWNSISSDISKISVMVLMARCDYILHRFLIDENDLGDRPLPTARLEEMIYILKQLARLVIHKETVCELPLHPHLRRGLGADNGYNRRAHLLVLFPSFCELVASRESRVRELVQVLLRLIAEELALGKFQALTGLTPL